MGEHLLRVLEDASGQRGIALLRDQLGRVVGRELVEEEEVGGGDGIAQQLDALADERRDGEQLLRRWRRSRPGRRRAGVAAELLDGQGADVLGVEPDGFGIEGIVFREIDDGVGAVDAFEREGRGELVESEELAVVFGRPAEQAEEVDESLGQKARVAIGGDADDGAVLALGELGAIGGDQQRQMRELGRRRTPRASKISRCLKVLVR